MKLMLQPTWLLALSLTLLYTRVERLFFRNFFIRIIDVYVCVRVYLLKK